MKVDMNWLRVRVVCIYNLLKMSARETTGLGES